ncbi:MAG TPA: DUF2306 domain-containing protein [Verrucomicrobiae bacterium]|jgi:uncharacterized membrane protein
MLSLIHVALSVVCLFVGAIIFFRPKGSKWHRRAGKIYSISMIVLNVAALGIFHLTGRLNLFHIMSILNLVLVGVGWAQIMFRRRLRNWVYRHYVYMSWSYVALVAAAINEGFVRLPPLKGIVRRNGNWVIIATQVVLIFVAAILINRNKERMVRAFQAS